MLSWISRIIGSQTKTERSGQLGNRSCDTNPTESQAENNDRLLLERQQSPIQTATTQEEHHRPEQEVRPQGIQSDIPKWALSIPDTVLFADVETTGIHGSDRVVSIGLIRLDTSALLESRILADSMHLIFDPGKKSHPRAEEIHGYDDWTLRHQDPFCTYAEQISQFIEKADLIVAHNARFDIDFINRELSASCFSIVDRPVYCTMENYRALELGGSAALSAICERLRISRQKETHGALEDAWLAMQVYLWLHGCPLYTVPFSFVADAGIKNFRNPPPRPEGPLPRRKRRQRVADV